MTDEPPGDVQQAVAWRFSSTLISLPSRQVSLVGQREQDLGDQRELEPTLAVLEGLVPEIADAGVLASADAVLDPGATAVTEFQQAGCPRPGSRR